MLLFILRACRRFRKHHLHRSVHLALDVRRSLRVTATAIAAEGDLEIADAVVVDAAAIAVVLAHLAIS